MISLLIAGSRTVTPTHEAISAWVDGLARDITGKSCEPREFIREVVCGCADGADRAGDEWAQSVGIYVHHDPITRDDMKLGKFIGPRMRNRRLAERADIGVVWWDGISGGSSDVCARMVARRKRCDVIPTKKRPPKQPPPTLGL